MPLIYSKSNSKQKTMNKLRINCICVVIIIVVTTCVNLCQAGASGTDGVEDVLDKLDAYALGHDSSSHLTMAELARAHSEIKSWSLAYRQQLVKLSPLIQLLVDFLFYPMERFHMRIGDSEVEHQAFIRRLEKNYARFRESYFGQMISKRSVNAPKTTSLVESLLELSRSKTLTMRLLMEAKIEFDTWLARVGEIPESEDIYNVLDEFEALRNYMARPSTKILAKHIFSATQQISEKQFPKLKQVFADEMEADGLVVHDGQLLRIN